MNGKQKNNNNNKRIRNIKSTVVVISRAGQLKNSQQYIARLNGGKAFEKRKRNPEKKNKIKILNEQR